MTDDVRRVYNCFLSCLNKRGEACRVYGCCSSRMNKRDDAFRVCGCCSSCTYEREGRRVPCMRLLVMYEREMKPLSDTRVVPNEAQ